MPEDVDAQEHLAVAHECLVEARVLSERGLHRGAVSAAYYAMFHAAHAALLAMGVQARTHKGLIHAFRQAFIVPGELEESYLRALDRALRLRLEADYGIGAPPPTAADAKLQVDAAARFVAAMERRVTG